MEAGDWKQPGALRGARCEGNRRDTNVLVEHGASGWNAGRQEITEVGKGSRGGENGEGVRYGNAPVEHCADVILVKLKAGRVAPEALKIASIAFVGILQIDTMNHFADEVSSMMRCHANPLDGATTKSQ